MTPFAPSAVRDRSRLKAALSRPWLTATCVAAFCTVVGMAISLANWPLPQVQDEFSYLLAADTFAHGRLANPPHPQWERLETLQELFQPTYASKYPPGQGLALAAGQHFAGHPAAGLWMLSGLGAAATYWMLLGWTSPRLSLLGALLWAFHPSFQLEWGQTFWGGTLAFIGGALVFGAALRLLHRAATREAIIMALGAMILAATRPFEGAVFCLATGAYVLWHWTRFGWPTRRELAVKIALPLGLVLIAGGTSFAVYNRAVTGDPLTLPYALHQETYGQTPIFLLGETGPPRDYRHAVFQDFHGVWEKSWYERQATLTGWLYTKAAVTYLAGAFFLTPVLFVALLACRPRRWIRLTPAVAVAAATYAATLLVTWYNPHYWAPFVPMLFVAAAAGLRRIDVHSRRWMGFRLSTWLVGLQAALFVVASVAHVQKPHPQWVLDRARIIDRLAHAPGRHLILVSYGTDHNCHAEWVFNGADIDGSKLVWARSTNAEGNAELMRYFPDRQVWLVEPEGRRMTLVSRGGDAMASAKGGNASSVTPSRYSPEVLARE